MPLPPLATERWSERTISRGHSAVRSWDVTGVTTQMAALNTVQTQFGVAEWMTHPEDSRLRVPAGGMDARNEQGPAFWRVTAKYDTIALTGASNPIDEPALITPNFGCTTEAIDKDVYGNPICNSARIPFPGVYDEYTNLSITIERWESTYDLAKVLAYTFPKPKLNKDTVTIARVGTFLPGQLKMRSIRAVNSLLSQASLDPVVRVCYEIEARAYYQTTGDIRGDLGGLSGISGFMKRILDQGRQGRYIVSGAGRPGKIVQYVSIDPNSPSAKTMLEVSDEVLLDGYGEPFAKQDYFVDNASYTADPQDAVDNGAIVEKTEKAVFLYYLTNEVINFSGLGLPS